MIRSGIGTLARTRSREILQAWRGDRKPLMQSALPHARPENSFAIQVIRRSKKTRPLSQDIYREISFATLTHRQREVKNASTGINEPGSGILIKIYKRCRKRLMDTASQGMPCRKASWKRLLAQWVYNLLLLPMSRLTADFFNKPYTLHAHTAIDSFTHVINR